VDNSLMIVAGLAAVVAVVATVVALRAGRRASKAADLVSQLLEPPVVEAAVVPEPTVADEDLFPPEAAPDPAADPVAAPSAAPVAAPVDETPDRPAPVAESPGLELPVAGPFAPTTPEPPTSQPPPAPLPSIVADLGDAADGRGAPATPEPFVADAPRLVGRDERRSAPLPVAEGVDPAPARIPVLDLDRLRSWLTLGDLSLGRLAIVSVELDNLPFVEERLGYAAGAHLIEAITQRLRTVTRPRDVVAHVNRERFVLVCRDVPDRSAAQGLAERIAMGVAHPSVVLAGVAEVTASIGVALAGHLDERPESVLRRAIKAGNDAKELGGARIEISEPPASATFADGELSAAIARDELRLHYLPIVSCATGRVAGFEALVRWEHPDHGLLLPGDFLPEAEEKGTIVPLGLWTIEQACRQMASWQGTAGALKLNLNLSARQFAEPALPAQLKRIISETGLVPGAVWLEITEDTLLHDRDASEATLLRLHELGVRLVIDDFGTGASSLVSLKRFPLDAIKIAATFVTDLGRNRDSDAICSAIVDLAHSLGLCAIAEGVETLEQFAALRALGCELAQGHLFGPARPAEEYGATPSTTMGVVGPTDGAVPPR
jgi:diguanylate cyclase (GGDEF)-like protein